MPIRLLALGLASAVLFSLPAYGQVASPDGAARAQRFVGIVLVSHGRLAREAKATSELIVGQQQGLVALSVDPNDDIAERRQAIIDAVKNTDHGCGVLIMADMFGGTPSNLAISVMVPGKVEVVSGLNIPMLIKAISMRGNCDLMVTADNAKLAGQKYISIASELLRKAASSAGEGEGTANAPKADASAR